MPTEIADGVYDITVRRTAERRYRVFVFDGESPTLVDTGIADDSSAVTAGLDQLEITPERLIITHDHPDHLGGFDDIVEEYDVESYIPELTDRSFNHRPDVQYTDGDQIGRFEAVHVPGHTSDSHALVDETAGVAVLGDALWGGDWRGLPKGYFTLPTNVYSEDLNQAEASLENLLPYEFNVGLVFHGTSVLEDASEKIREYFNFPERPEA